MKKSPFAESSWTLASAVAESFPEDIIMEILLRLPAMSLMRFKCVCKGWRSLISDPAFAKSHLQRLRAGDMISSQRIFKTCPFETINYEALDGSIGSDDDHAVVKSHDPRIDASSCPELVGSCDGLVCLSMEGRLALNNPTTKESRNLPRSGLLHLRELLQGFGYDSQSDDYKIVQGERSENGQDGFEIWQMEIFSLKAASWKKTQAQLERHLSLVHQERGVYWNGALHWLAKNEGKLETMISFNLSEEKFEQVLPIPEVNGNTNSMGLGIHGANLFIYHRPLFQLQPMMCEYMKGGSWAKMFSVSTTGMPSLEIPVAYTRSGKIVFQLAADNIILFNPEDNTYEDYPIEKSGNIYSTIYVETLISPNLSDEPSRI
ncbi:hypothetical protein BT93_H1546 [Corymbia citriodora subsp. variegata]|nr:hypothetical protein BT93_H1546 [Corymbia citriodora subsp. variegata]